MNRITAAVAAAAFLGIFAAGLALAAPSAQSAAQPAAAPALAPEDAAAAASAESLDIWMSDEEDGPPIRSVMSNTNQVWAVVAYEEALNEQYQVQLRDLSGILVKAGPLLANGTGRASVAISVTDFVDAYRAILDADRRGAQDACASEACTMTESIDEADTNCQGAPPAPPTWPEPSRPTPVPGQPTPTPDPQDPYTIYRLWLDSTLSEIATSGQAMVEVTRTNRSLLAMPDAAADPTVSSNTQESTDLLIDALADLRAAETELNPPDRVPDVAAGCALVTDAKSSIATSNDLYAATDPILADATSWRLPPTASRWVGSTFVGCVQYQTNLMAVVGGVPGQSPRASVVWTVGEPGAPALIFPSADQIDRNSRGELNLTLPESAKAIYSQVVTAPGANHEGRISGFVTDRLCIPVDGATMTFGISPEDAGTLGPTTAVIENGVVYADFEAGQEHPRDTARGTASVTGFVAEGQAPGAPPGITSNIVFEIVGPAYADNMRFLMRRPEDREINFAKGETMNFQVEARDEFNRAVADGSTINVSIPADHPAVIGYHKYVGGGRPGQPTPTPEFVSLGKELEMLTRDGLSQLPSGDDPGATNVGPVIACTAEGGVTLSATIDGQTVNTNDPDLGIETIRCRSLFTLYLPQTLMKHDILYQQPTNTPRPIETVTPSPTP